MTFIKQSVHHVGIGVLCAGIVAIFALGLGSFTLVHAQSAPTVSLSPIDPITVTEGDVASFTASATASDASSTISFALSGEPSGASIDAGSGAFEWDTTGASAQTYLFSVAATGDTGGSDSKDVSITVEAIIVPHVESATSTDATGGTATTTGGTIETGDATATTTVDNSLNTSAVNPDEADQKMNASNLIATSTNQAILSSAATSTAATGENSVLGGVETNTIVTGNAISTANVINEVNTNIFNSDGLILFINQLFGGGIDLTSWDLSYFFAGSPGSSPSNKLPGTSSDECTLLTCLNSSAINVLDMNVATVTNSVIVRSSTGDNVASSTGDAVIDTGNAYAAANVVNLVNTNIINSSYLLVSFNQFGDLDENVTLPGADFFDELFAGGSNLPEMNSSTYDLSADNAATTTGSVVASADTGGNIASTTAFVASSTPEGSGDIETGEAYASASSFTQQNTNHIGGTSVFFLFRTAGEWSGNIIGLPDGLTAEMTEDGLVIQSADATTTPLSMADGCTYGYRNRSDNTLRYSHTSGDPQYPSDQYQYVGVVGGPCYNSSAFLASATNTAVVENNVDVLATTGGNEATTQDGEARVGTGNAYASASAVNLINTNIVGQNWIFGVFNIFGDMSGDIVFGGSPTLAVLASPSVSQVAPGGDVSYTFTVTNSGGADADDVVLNASFDNTLLTFSSGELDMTTTPTGASWRVGEVRRGESRAFTAVARVGTNFPAGQTAQVPFRVAAVNDSIASPSASEMIDASIIVSSPAIESSSGASTGPSGGGGGGGGGGGPSGGGGGGPSASSQSANQAGRVERTSNPQVSVDKTATLSTSTSAVDYQVIVYNQKSAGPVYGGILTDTLYDPEEKIVYTRSWDLATIAPGDEIKLTYTVDFATTTEPGAYKNIARVTGNRNYAGAAGKAMTPVEGSASVHFGAGRVLGVATSNVAMATSTTPTVCAPLLIQNMRPGIGNNSIEVQKLQTFLNGHVGSNLPITGYFGPMTTQAVKQFQTKYAAEILAPVGLSAPSGLVFTMTLGKINALGCGGALPTAQSFVPPISQVTAAATVAPPVPRAAAAASAPVKKAPAKVAAPALREEPASAPSTPAPLKKESGGLFGWIKSLF